MITRYSPRSSRTLAKRMAIMVALCFSAVLAIIRSGLIFAPEVYESVAVGGFDWLKRTGTINSSSSSQNVTLSLQQGALVQAGRSMSAFTHSSLPSLYNKTVEGIHPWLIKELQHATLPPSNCSLDKLWIRNKTCVGDMCYPLSMQQACKAAKLGFGPEGHHGYELLKKIRPIHNTTPKRNPRILCMIYTSKKSHHRIRTITHTWGKRCDGFLAFSDETDPSIGALNLPHDGPESYENMWQKTRSIVKFAHDHYLDDFDFFHLCGDDTYLVLENMREYLASDELMMLGSPSSNTTTIMPQSYNELKPLLLGAPMFRTRKWYACSGGPGYTLNRASLQLFDKKIFHSCGSNLTTSAEDVQMSLCLWMNGVKCSGWDEKERARRYHGLDAEYQASQEEKEVGPMGSPKLAKRFQIHLKGYIQGASNFT